MSDEIDQFSREYQQFHSISRDRAKQQLRLIAKFEERLGGRSLLTVTGRDFQDFAGFLMDSGYHVNTVRKQLNMVRPFFSWAYASQRITADQFMSIRQVKNPRGSTSQTTPNPYKKAELQLFWKALEEKFPFVPESGKGSHALKNWMKGNGRWTGVLYRHAMRLQLEAMVHLALDSGLRRHEIFALSLDDLHYDNEYLVVNGKADPSTGLKKVRSVPFTTEARVAVKAWLEFRALMRPEHKCPWVSCWARTHANPMWYTRFKDLLQCTVGKEWRWHRFRHTCATNWLRAGVDLEIVSILLGHSTIQQTLCYAQIIRSDISRHLATSELRFDDLRGRKLLDLKGEAA